MALLELVHLISFWTALVVSLGWAGVLARTWQVTTTIRPLPRTMPDGRERRVSAVLAARNEAPIIERALRSLLAQEGVAMQVVAVDDGSTDGTFEKMSALAREDPRLLVLKNEKLPAGWVAKNYALELGQGRADGEFLLFTDADVIHGRRAVAHALSVMEGERLDHLALHPRLEASTLVEAFVLPLYFLLCEFRFVDPRSVRADSGVGAGVGAFNLVRAESYRLRGTHARIRGAMLDDRALGRMMRDDGGRGTVLRAMSEVRMRPYRSLDELYRGIKKGTLSSFANSGVFTLVMGLALVFAALAPIGFLLTSGPLLYVGTIPWVALPAVLGIALPIAGLLKARTMVRFEPVAALLFPVGALVIGAAALHAALVFFARGTVEWRGRSYTKRDLSSWS